MDTTKSYREFEYEDLRIPKKSKPYKREEFKSRNWQDFVDEDELDELKGL